MSKSVDLTVNKLRHHSNLEGSAFLMLYERLMRGENLSEEQLVEVLRFAVLFLRSSDKVVSRLGYRIILQYGELSRDYEPLHAVAQARDLIPIVSVIERLAPELIESDSLSSNFFAAHSTNFVTVEQGGTTLLRTRGQMELRAFNAREREAIVVAPTSYGKSEMLIDKVAQNLDFITCVLVPTRALISQTRALVIGDSRIREARIRVLTHPDAYTGENHFVAVMTQERLHRLLTENPELQLDQLLVDEAHNLLPGDARAVELSQVVLTARARNSNLAITYYTPFISDPDNLKHVYEADQSTKAKSVEEYVKVERIIYALPGANTKLYDQFLNRMIDLKASLPDDEVATVMALAAHRTLVYVNRPKDAQDLAARLAQRYTRVELSVEAQRAIKAIGDLIDPNYSLIRAIESGIVFHHGQVPDILRQYIERLFRNDSSLQPRLLVTTSTLLEGVNTPADCLIMMTPSRGRKHLSRSAFRNLIGRVARFREIFDSTRTDLDLLQPRIYLVPSSYARSKWNVETFLSKVANLAKTVEDDVDNPLLERADDSVERQKELEFLENIERGSTQLANPRITTTDVGKLCFQYGIRDFDIFANEERMQERVDVALAQEQVFQGPTEVINGICDLFFDGIELIRSEDLARLRDAAGARRFYSMFLEWRTRNEPFKRLISRFVQYWSQLDDEYVFVGSRWGEETYGDDGVRKLYVRMSSKNPVEMINLAIAKIKEEQDFVDFRIVKYIEVLNALGFIERDFYHQIKYGTADPFLICLLRNGFSLDLARLIEENYSRFVVANIPESTVVVGPGLPVAMDSREENDILIYEAETLVTAAGLT